MPPPRFRMPGEADPHARTVLGWPTASSITGTDHAYKGAAVQSTWTEIATLAKAIAKYEPVNIYVQGSSFADDPDSEYLRAAADMIGNVPNISVHFTLHVESLWLRDTGPIIVKSLNGPIENRWGEDDDPGVGFTTQSTESTTVAMTLNFNQWGRKNRSNNDTYTAEAIGQSLSLSVVRAPFVAEGGGIEVDGEGTFLATESAILNPNRNPGIDKETMEDYLKQYLGIEKAIWIPGRRGRDVTDDHIDAVARFARPGVILLSRPYVDEGDDRDKILAEYLAAKELLSKETDAKGRQLTIIDVPEPSYSVLGNVELDDGPSVSYVNFLVVNGAVILSKFGDEQADIEAKRIIGEQFPERKIEQVPIHQIGLQGGGIHCSTKNIFA